MRLKEMVLWRRMNGRIGWRAWAAERAFIALANSEYMKQRDCHNQSSPSRWQNISYYVHINTAFSLFLRQHCIQINWKKYLSKRCRSKEKNTYIIFQHGRIVYPFYIQYSWMPETLTTDLKKKKKTSTKTWELWDLPNALPVLTSPQPRHLTLRFPGNMRRNELYVGKKGVRWLARMLLFHSSRYIIHS